MKKMIFIAAVTVATAVAFSCQKNEQAPVLAQTELRTFTCTISSDPDSKVSIANDGKTAWEVDDEILIHGEYTEGVYCTTVKLEAGNISADGRTATFTIGDITQYNRSGDGWKSTLYAAYPASAVIMDDHCYWNTRFKETNLPLMAAYNDDNTFVFYNLCGVITFVVSGTFDSYVFEGNDGETVGYSAYQTRVRLKNDNSTSTDWVRDGDSFTSVPVTTVSGSVVADGVTINRIFLPTGANFTSGFTIKFLQGGVIKKAVSTNTAKNVARNKILTLGNITDYLKDYVAIPDSEKATATELSNPKSANCYVVDGSVASNKKKVFKFPAVKGNTYVYESAAGTSVGTVASVGIVWETWNNAETVTENSVIKAVSYKEGFVYFKMPAKLHAGNALIAAYDGPYDGDGKPTGNILWSWHIWVPTDDVVSNDVTDATIFGDKPIMDRNLGALVAAPAGAVASVESYGLFYQWGRKDPFPGMGAVASDGVAKVAGTTMTKINGTMTIAETIQNPTKYAWNSSDWCDAGDQSMTLWTTTKTIYDPCPPGYIVPTRNSSLHYWGSTALNSLGATDNFVNNGGTYYSYQLGTNTAVVFPYAGYIDNDSGSYYKAGQRSAVWSSYCSTLGKAYARDSRHDSGTFNRSELKTSRGASVRCVAE